METTDDPEPMERRRCTAHSSQTGERCKRTPVKGATVCASHGGRAPQVRAKAAERVAVAELAQGLTQLAPQLAADGHHPLEHLVDAVAAARAAAAVAARDYDAGKPIDFEVVLKAISLAVTATKTVLDVGFDERRARLAEGQRTEVRAVLDRVIDGILDALRTAGLDEAADIAETAAITALRATTTEGA